MLEARELLEVRLAELAATRRTDDDLAAMRAALVAMEAEIASAGLGMDGDAAFHHAVHRAGNNKVLEHVIDGLAEAIHETRVESLSEPDRPRNSLLAHRRILEAIEAQDVARAADAMRAHLRQVADVALLRWEPPLEDPVAAMTPPSWLEHVTGRCRAGPRHARARRRGTTSTANLAATLRPPDRPAR